MYKLLLFIQKLLSLIFLYNIRLILDIYDSHSKKIEELIGRRESLGKKCSIFATTSSLPNIHSFQGNVQTIREKKKEEMEEEIMKAGTYEQLRSFVDTQEC